MLWAFCRSLGFHFVERLKGPPGVRKAGVTWTWLFSDSANLKQIYIVDLACVASVSVRFRSKERGTRVKDRAKNGAMKRAGRGWGFLPSLSFFGSPFISRAVKTEIPFLGLFFGSETKRKRLLRRLLLMGLAECIKITLLSLIILFFHEHQQRKHVNQGKKGPQKSLHDLTSSSKNKRGSGNARKFPRSLPRTCFVWFLKVRVRG